MRYVSDFFKERPPRCQNAETAESEDIERKASLQMADAERNNHYSYSRPVWARPLTLEPSVSTLSQNHWMMHSLQSRLVQIRDKSTRRCSDAYTGTDYTPIHRIVIPISERERAIAWTNTLYYLLYSSDRVYCLMHTHIRHVHRSILVHNEGQDPRRSAVFLLLV